MAQRDRRTKTKAHSIPKPSAVLHHQRLIETPCFYKLLAQLRIATFGT
ncbi:MAG: virulence promoting factor [Myxococcales bacterium]|nr:virulence promoting factor [Myxococcales bacterium]